MGLTYNSSEISGVTYNGAEVQQITYNGTEIWSAQPSVGIVLVRNDGERSVWGTLENNVVSYRGVQVPPELGTSASGSMNTSSAERGEEVVADEIYKTGEIKFDVMRDDSKNDVHKFHTVTQRIFTDAGFGLRASFEGGLNGYSSIRLVGITGANTIIFNQKSSLEGASVTLSWDFSTNGITITASDNTTRYASLNSDWRPGLRIVRDWSGVTGGTSSDYTDFGCTTNWSVRR